MQNIHDSMKMKSENQKRFLTFIGGGDTNLCRVLFCHKDKTRIRKFVTAFVYWPAVAAEDHEEDSNLCLVVVLLEHLYMGEDLHHDPVVVMSHHMCRHDGSDE